MKPLTKLMLAVVVLYLFYLYLFFVKQDIKPIRSIPMLQTEKKDFLLCIGNGRIIDANLCGWCRVENEEQAIACFNKIGGTQK